MHMMVVTKFLVTLDACLFVCLPVGGSACLSLVVCQRSLSYGFSLTLSLVMVTQIIIEAHIIVTQSVLLSRGLACNTTLP